MKVLNVKGNKVSFDFTEDEYNILLRHGLQLFIDKEHGKNKVKVLPHDPSIKYDKDHTYDLPDVLANECLSIAVNQSLQDMIDRLEKENKHTCGRKKKGLIEDCSYETSAIFCKHANEMPNECKCPKNCYCKRNSCKKEG